MSLFLTFGNDNYAYFDEKENKIIVGYDNKIGKISVPEDTKLTSICITENELCFIFKQHSLCQRKFVSKY